MRAPSKEAKPSLVVVGHGMVGQRLLASLVDLGLTRRYDVAVFGDEPRLAYDRVALSSLFDGLSPGELSLAPAGFFEQSGIVAHTGVKVTGLNRSEKKIVTDRGTIVPYDKLVLATGSWPFIPPLPGHDLEGCFAYRTVEDVNAIRRWAERGRTGAVIGGGLLGLEAAKALKSLGLETHVVERAPRLMPLQVDEGGGLALRRRVEELGVTVHAGAETREIVGDETSKVHALRFADDRQLPLDMVVFSAGIRPRDELAERAGLERGERGGIRVDEACRTSDPDIYAIGECAFAAGQIWGLVGPGYAMADVVADQLAGGSKTFTGADVSTKLKLLGIDVASFGDAFGKTPGARDISFRDLVKNVYKRLVLSADGRLVLGGILVGDTTAYGVLSQMAKSRMPVPPTPEQLILPVPSGSAATVGVDSLPDEALICSCNNVEKRQICRAIADGGLRDVGAVKACTKAGTGCGGCATLVADLLRLELTKAGVATPRGICEHFDYTRQELFDLLRVEGILTFGELLLRYGRGRGCELCKPAVASMLASMAIGAYVLEGEQASLQDTNDHFLANLQKDGSYSVVPRIPGGEVTPDKLIVLGEVARDFGLYLKITGGQRIDMFGARVDQLPQIWLRLVAAGFESGHAYAKALRTVKSCVGSTWCRFGVGDSVALAIELELRYRGLRAPHKVKAAVSGCARECAEAKGKDFGVIATERGWTLYVCGNGGMRPQHAVLFASDLEKGTLVRYIDRFLMFYIRTAGRLERTATWLNKRPGGIDELRRILVDDELGICAELEADMARHIANYRCEWKSTLEDPERMARFVHFVNSTLPDPNVLFVKERGQIRPARADEKPEPSLLVRGLEVEVVG